ncbi:hypothetical protein [Roseomonas xinghualingensis]|uniref:hypothetical protein n=1 Tax=Roseomonas xinghualingensis TaxID=2986475 RepID=UPI0021F15433|nr:hypothetical protein [Roseomonas sp. SXEYE001]MCV4207567.1 hypothetical protein [Roseomonas sp. SXEYE001]
MMVNPGLLALEANLEVYGKPVTYLSPDGMVDLPDLTGLILKTPVPLGPDAEDTGGITQLRQILRLRAEDFPEGVEPEQGALVTVDGERSNITDVLADENGWYDLPLGEAPE